MIEQNKYFHNKFVMHERSNSITQNMVNVEAKRLMIFQHYWMCRDGLWWETVNVLWCQYVSQRNTYDQTKCCNCVCSFPSWEVTGLNLGPGTSSSAGGWFSGFTLSLHVDAVIVPKIRPQLLFPQPFPLIIHSSSYHLTPYMSQLLTASLKRP
jgi:hypothetical protein